MQTTEQVRDANAIYARRSKDLDQQGKNVAAQVRDMRKLAISHGDKITDDHIYVDNDISASRFAKKARTDWKRLLQAIEHGAVRNIYTLWLNRLLRLPADLEHLIDLALSGKFACIITEAMTLDLRTVEGQAMARQMAGMADMEVQQLSHRVRRRKQQDRDEGKAGHGVVQFGWLGTRHGHSNDDGDTIHEPEAKLLRQAAQQVLAGVPLATIARQWNANDVPMPLHLHRHVRDGVELKPANWSAGNIARTLQKPRNAGYQVHDGVIIGRPWSSIYTDDVWQQLVAYFERRTYGPRSTRSGRWTGFVRCGGLREDGTICGATMLASPPKGSRPGVFKCTRKPGHDVCGKNSVVMHHVEAAAFDWIADYLDDDMQQRMCQDTSNDTAALFAQLQKLNQAQQQLENMLGTGDITAQAFKRSMAANAKQREQASRKLASASVQNGMTPYLGRGTVVRAALDSGDMDKDEQRALFLATGAYCWVRPTTKRSNQFDQSRLHFGETAPRAWTKKARDTKREAA